MTLITDTEKFTRMNSVQLLRSILKGRMKKQVAMAAAVIFERRVAKPSMQNAIELEVRRRKEIFN